MVVKELEIFLNKKIKIHLKDKRELEGVLLAADNDLNFVLSDTVEKTKKGSRELGVIILRGSQIVDFKSD